MSDRNIKHFLVIYDIPNAHADVHPFDTDYAAALEAYSRTEGEHRNDEHIEVVLLGSDSYEAIQRTHSSYFMLAGKHADDRVAAELAELGLR